MIPRLVLLLLLSLPSLHAATSSAGWKQFSNTQGNFTILFPGVPQYSAEKDKDMVYHSARTVIGKNAIYQVDWMNTGQLFKKSPDLKASFAEFKTNFLEGMGKCTVISDGPASPALQNYIGWRHVCHAPNDSGIEVTHSITVHYGKSNCYILSVLWPTAEKEPPEVARFIQSFRLLDPSR